MKLNIEAIAKLETGTSRSHVERDQPGAFGYGATMQRFVLHAPTLISGWHSRFPNVLFRFAYVGNIDSQGSCQSDLMVLFL